MSADALKWAWAQIGLEPEAKLVLLALAWDTWDDLDYAAVTCAQIEGRTGLDRATIYRKLATLESAKLIARQPSAGNRRRYVLSIALRDVAHSDMSQPATSRTQRLEMSHTATRDVAHSDMTPIYTKRQVNNRETPATVVANSSPHAHTHARGPSQLEALARRWGNSPSGKRWFESSPWDWSRPATFVAEFRSYLEWTGKSEGEVAQELRTA